MQLYFQFSSFYIMEGKISDAEYCIFFCCFQYVDSYIWKFVNILNKMVILILDCIETQIVLFFIRFRVEYLQMNFVTLYISILRYLIKEKQNWKLNEIRTVHSHRRIYHIFSFMKLVFKSESIINYTLKIHQSSTWRGIHVLS